MIFFFLINALNSVLSWLLVPKMPQDEYTFGHSMNQDSKQGQEIVNIPESRLLLLHHLQVGGTDLPLVSVCELRVKNLMI